MAARDLALERAVVALEPAAHRGRCLDRALEPHLVELVERLAVVGLRRENERVAAGGKGGRILEQVAVVALHLAQVIEQGLREGIATGEAEEAGEAIELVAVRGQRM